MIGKKLLNYQIESLIGKGGMGSVYLASNLHIDQKVAVKVLNTELANNQEVKNRFKREATTLSSLDHPNIVKFLNYYEDEQGVYLIMEYIKGRTLDEYITKETGPIPEEKMLDLFSPILDAFTYAHGQGIVHRDIKPSNIIITHDMRVKILDFGIARILNEAVPTMTKVGTKMGTAMYMSPEQIKAQEVDKRSDIFSLGIVLHQMITGSAPYDDTTMSEFEIHQNLVENDLPRAKSIYPYITDKVQEIVDKATQKKADDRYQDCENFKYALTKAIKPEEAVKPHASPIYKWIAASIAVLIIAAGIWLWDYNRVKVTYYKDYVEQWGVPKGIYKLSKEEYSHRAESYRMEFQKRKLRRLTLVNSVGKIREHHDSEHMERPSDMKLYYKADGNLDYSEILDRNGKILFRKDYSHDMKVMTYRRADEFGTELSLSARTLKIHQNPMGDNNSKKGQISRFLLTYDNNGYLTKLEYAKYQNIKVGDVDGIYARRYERDQKGRVIKETYLGANGNIKNTKKGLAIREHEFTENDDWTKTSYFDRNHNPSKDETGVPVVNLYYDEYGNRIKEEYVNSKGELVYRNDSKSAGFEYVYDEKGFNIERTYFDIEGNKAVGSNGIVGRINFYDTDGNVVKFYNINIENEPAYNTEGGYYGYNAKYDESGNMTELWFIDKDEKIVASKNGHAGISWKYDSIGNKIEVIYYAEDKKPILTSSGVAGYWYSYNDMNLVSEVQCLNTSLKIAPSENDGIAIWRNQYDKRGNRTGVAYYDKNGINLTSHLVNGIAGWGCKYDKDGNQVEFWYYDSDSSLTTTSNNYAMYKSEYDEQGNETTRLFYDTEGNIVENSSGYAGWVAQYDERGNEVLDKKLDVNKENAKGWLVGKSRYDDNDNKIEYMLYDYKGNLAVGGNGYAGWKAEYDKKNNQTKISYYGKDGKLILSEGGFAFTEYAYDEKGNLVSGKFYDVKGKPVASTSYGAPMFIKKYDNMGNVVYQGHFKHDGKTPMETESGVHYGTFEYDKFGNMTCLTGYDKEGKFTPYVNGCGRKRMKYDLQGNVIETTYHNESDNLVNCDLGYAVFKQAYNKKGKVTKKEYYDKNNAPVIEKDNNAHIVETIYNEKGQNIEMRYYGTNGKLRTNIYAIRKFNYNTAGYWTEDTYFDAKGKRCRANEEYDYYKIIYERDADGNTIYKKYYQLDGKLYATLDSEGNRVYSNEEICAYINSIKTPNSIVDGLDFVNAKCSNRRATFTWKLPTWSKYEMSDSKKSEFKDTIKGIAKENNNVTTLQSVNWKITVIVNDKANRELFRYYF